MKRYRPVLAVGLLLLSSLAHGAGAQQTLNVDSIVVPGPGAWELLVDRSFDSEGLDQRERGLRLHHLEVPLGPRPAALAFQPAAVPPATEVLDDPPFPVSLNRDVTAVRLAASTVAEPTVASDGRRVLLTGNWFAAVSSDGGESFSFVNPEKAFPISAHGVFCCDQVALYAPQHQTFFWLLQYEKSTAGNVYRIAFAGPEGFDDDAWKIVDLWPTLFQLDAGLWLDYPDLAVTDEYLFLTANVFKGRDFQKAIVMRLYLDELLAGRPVTIDYVLEPEAGSLRFTQGARETMWGAAHSDPATLFVYRWPAAEQAGVERGEVFVTPWTPPDHDLKQSVGPDGHDWLGRFDHRVTAGWHAGSRLGFAWAAAKDDDYPHPHIRVALIDEATLELEAQPHIWNPHHAYAYPAAAVGPAGEVAVGLAFGGGAWHPSYAVGFLREGESPSWELAAVARGTDGPGNEAWGDYLAVRPEPGTAGFLGTGIILRGGDTRRFARARIVRFASQP